MHGGRRDKATRLLATHTIFDHMAVQCSRDHDHLPWGIHRNGSTLQFDTASEAEYPTKLCQTMATALADFVGLPPVTEPPLSSSQIAQVARGATLFTRKPLIPEFSHFEELPHELQLPGRKLLTSQFPGGTSGMTSEEDQLSEHDSSQNPPQEPCRKAFKRAVRYGIQWTPEEFLDLAKQANHPLDPQQAVRDSVKQAVVDNLTKSPVELAKSRMRAVIMIDSMKKELQAKEEEMKERLEVTVAQVTSSKNILLWESLLRASHYPDMGVVELMKTGVDLVGEHTYPPNFPKDWKPAAISPEDLLESARWRRQALKVELNERDEKRDEDLEKATMEEVGAGFLQGPFRESQVDEIFDGPHWLMNKRFLLYQGTPEEPKARVIDDCRRSGLNSAYTTNFKLQLMDIDSLACVIALISQALVDKCIKLDLETNETIGGNVASEVLQESWQGRTLDLAKAYKQVPITPASRRLCIIGHQIKKEWQFYTTNVMPFGAVASVYAFNRISRSIHHILTSFLSAVCTVFYDDFPTISSKAGASLLSKCMSHVLNSLGWLHAQVGTKAVDFASEFNALGVCVGLERLPSGVFSLANKEGRIRKVADMLREIGGAGTISRKTAAEIQGLLNFASGFFLSKALRFLLGAFEKLADRPSSQSAKSLKMLCQTAIHLLEGLPPRTFDARKLQHTHLLFTDGSWEGHVAKAGAVFINGLSGNGWVAEILVPDKLISIWRREVGEQIISQVEYFAFLVLRFAVAEQLRDQKAIAWIDNEAARATAIKGNSDSSTLRGMARVSQQLEATSPALLWYERVASYSNPADGPSRDRVQETGIQLGLPSLHQALCLPDRIADVIIDLISNPWMEIDLKGEPKVAP